MKQRQLGTGGPMVGAVALGCMSFGGIFGATDLASSHRCLDRAWEMGVSHFDIANIYGMGVCEQVVGSWIASRGHAPSIATKAAVVNGPPRRFDNSPDHMRAELEGSLTRLGVERVDLFYVHRREAARPVEEVAQTMATLVAEGKIGGYGLSEVSPGTLRRAHAMHPVRAVQNEYSLWTRQPELGMIQTCAELGVAFVPFSPLARGALGDPGIGPAALPPGDFRLTIPRFQEPDWALNRARIAAFRGWCDARGWAVPAVALAWVLDQGPHLIPIPGTRSADHLSAWASADQIVFSADDRAEIARLLPVGFAFGDRYGTDQAASVERYC